MWWTGLSPGRNWLARRRLPLVAITGLLLCVAFSASAEWTVRDLPSTPHQVEVWTPDVYSVSTLQAGWLLSLDGGSVRSNPPSVGTYSTHTGCFASFQPSGTVAANPVGCVPSANILPLVPAQLTQVKHTQAGHAYALGFRNASEAEFAYADGGVFTPGPWQFLQPPLPTTATTEALGVLSLQSGAHALFGVKTPAMAFHWYRGPQLLATYVAPAPQATAVPLAIDLFPSGGSSPTALLGTSAGLLRGTLGDAGFPFSAVPLPGGEWAVPSVDVNTGAGSVYGDGFGMALVPSDGGTIVLRAVPASRFEEVGTSWRVSAQAPFPAPPGQVACHGAELCVVTLDKADLRNIAIYRNSRPPTLDGGMDTPLPEGSSRTLFITVDDPDGDPVRTTVEPRTLDTPALSMTTSDEDGGVRLMLTSGIACSDSVHPVRITASDGLLRHEQRANLNVQVLHTRQPDAPRLSTADVVVQAGREAGALTVLGQANPPCRIATYYWSALTPSAPALATSGGSATFPTPSTLCLEGGQSYRYRVQAIDEGGLLSSPMDFSVRVRPWGVPLPAFGPDAGVGLDAGQTAELVPQAEHLCKGSPGYPGVDTRWELTEGAPLPQGVRLRTEDGGIVTGGSAVTRRLAVETEACADARLLFTVRHAPRDDSGIEGPASTIQVRVDPRWVPLSEGQLVLTPTTSTPEGVAGTVDVEGLNCVQQRGLKARLRLESEDGGLSGEATLPVPGPWEFPLENVCEGGLYRVSGELLGGPGLRAEPGTAIAVEVPPAEIPLEPLEEPRLTARCQEGAVGTFRQPVPSTPCPVVPLTWEQVAGPPLTLSSLTGPQIDVATQEKGLGELVGESVVLRVTANAGKVTRREHTVRITADPFVQLRHHTERPSGAEMDLIGVSVELRNTTACGVREVSYVERFEGVDYVPGSARFNGVPVEAESVNDALTVRGLVLEGDSTGQLTYVVRPRLFGQQRFTHQAFLRDVPISLPPEEPLTGCGCTGGGAGAAVWGLAGLLAGLRRRRRSSC